MAALAAIIATGAPTGAAAQTTAVDSHHPETLAQATPPAEPGDTGGQGQGAQPGQPDMMPPGMMGQGMKGGTPMTRMRGHTMKVMFAVADTNSDGSLSLEELTTIQKRIFDKVDADKDGNVTPEEVQASGKRSEAEPARATSPSAARRWKGKCRV
jgi:EF hand